MRIFVAGATGVIGTRVVPLLVAAGHEVAGMTRSAGKVARLQTLGATAVVCDVFDAAAVREAVARFGPAAVIHVLTDLPDRLELLDEHTAANNRIRREGTRNLLAAAEDAGGVSSFLAESVAWELSGDAAAAKADLESAVLGWGGVVLRYGRLYGPGTYYEQERPPPPRVDVETAARRTVAALAAPSGVRSIVDE